MARAQCLLERQPFPMRAAWLYVIPARRATTRCDPPARMAASIASSRSARAFRSAATARFNLPSSGSGGIDGSGPFFLALGSATDPHCKAKASG